MSRGYSNEDPWMANPSARHAHRRDAEGRQPHEARAPRDNASRSNPDGGVSASERTSRRERSGSTTPAAHVGKHVATRAHDERSQRAGSSSAHERRGRQQAEPRRDGTPSASSSQRRRSSGAYSSRASKRSTAKAAAVLANGRLELTEDEEAKSSSHYLKTLLIVLASMLYWPTAIVGVVTPFTAGFNFGTLSMGQVVFARFWLAFVLLGAIYAVIVNLGHIREAAIFAPNKVLRIALFLVADVAVSFLLIRLVCLF